ncbi:fibronectin type III domain-containing protein [Candidatus Dojkabacteria bacterium]|nr:fibronectin type III domain-containing protein [Candidatus Dojkabacteria bacterium]
MAYVPKKKRQLYVILFFVFIALIPISVGAFFIIQDWRSRASTENKPNEVRISNMTTKSVVISWITDSGAEGWVRYSTDPAVGEGSPLSQDDRDVTSGSMDKRTTHYVTLRSLNTGTKYYYVIGSGTQVFKDTNGNPFEFTTASIGESTSTALPDAVYGSVVNGTDMSAIVYITIENASGEKSFPISALTNSGGNFEMSLSDARTADLSAKFSYNNEMKMIIFAQGGDKGGAVLETSVGERDSISMTMDPDYTVTDIFADTSGVDVGGDEEPSQEEPAEESPQQQQPSEQPAQEEPTQEEPEEEAVSQKNYTITHDVPLTKMVLGASTVEETIKDVNITNVTENSFTVVWESSIKQPGSINYGSAANALTDTAKDDRDTVVSTGQYYMHHITVKNLDPESTYFYVIQSGTKSYKNNGNPYQVTLPETLDSPPAFDSIAGQITGTGAPDSVVFGIITTDSGTSSEISTITDENGKWTMSIGSVRNQAYTDYFSYESSDSIVISAKTKGDDVSNTYVLSTIADDIVTQQLTLEEPETGVEFKRGLYDTIASTGTNTLPQTSVNRIAIVLVFVAVLMVGYGSYIMISVYNKGKGNTWENGVLNDLDI